MIKFRERTSTMWNATFRETGHFSLRKGFFILRKACLGLISLSLSIFSTAFKIPPVRLWPSHVMPSFCSSILANKFNKHCRETFQTRPNRFTLYVIKSCKCVFELIFYALDRPCAIYFKQCISLCGPRWGTVTRLSVIFHFDLTQTVLCILISRSGKH